jgi:hypothetical protein
MTKPTRAESPGAGVDSEGRAVVDPTANVLGLVEAANRRQDDLREAEARRMDELRRQESLWMMKLLDLRSDHAEELRIAEAKRIDAIRAYDTNAVAVAAQRSSDQASVLASQVAQSTEAMRALVARTDQALSTRISALELSASQQQGRSARDDPAMSALLLEVQQLRQATDKGAGARQGVSSSWSVVLGATGLIGTLIGIISAIALLTR